MFCKDVKYCSDGSISLHSPNEHKKLIQVSSWDTGCRVFTYKDKVQSDYSGIPYFSIFRLAPLLEPNYHLSPIAYFCRSIPSDLVHKLSKFQLHQLMMLNIVASNKPAQDLLLSNSILLWIFVDWVVENDVPTLIASKMLLDKQIIILRAVYPCANNTHLKFIKSLSLNKYDKSILNLIFHVFSNKLVLFQLRHIKKVDYGIINFLLKMDFHDEFEIKVILLILKRYKNESGINVPRLLHLYDDTLKMNKSISDSCEHPLINEDVLTIEKMYAEHNKLNNKINAPNYIQEIQETLMLNEMVGKSHEYDIFPKAFIPENENIIHIATYTALVNEGLEMNTCVLNYSQHIKNGDSCIYKVVHPVRGTLELKKKNDVIYIGQFSLKENQEPDNNSYLYIEEWLNG